MVNKSEQKKEAANVLLSRSMAKGKVCICLFVLPVGSNHKEFVVDTNIFPVTAANICADVSYGHRLKELFYHWPGLF